MIKNSGLLRRWSSSKVDDQKKSLSYPIVIHKTPSILLISVLVAVLLFILEPFHMDGYDGNKFLFSAGFGLITFVVVFFFNVFIKKRVVRSGKTSWQAFQEVVYILLLLATISVFNFIYISCTLIGGKFYWPVFVRILYYTYAFGIIPSIIVFLLKYNRYLLSNLTPKKTVHESFTIPTNQLTGKRISIPMERFIYAEARRNNVLVFFKKNGEIVSRSIRIPIGRLDEDNKSNHLFRCHNSFLINLKMVDSAKGNSNGYKLKMKGIDNTIMVSRRYAKDFRTHLDGDNAEKS